MARAHPDNTASRARLPAGWIPGTALLGWLVLLLANLFASLDYNRWDNFEYFTPILHYAHGLWLRGEVPGWNPHQHLGEPVLAAGQPGALYPLYTLSVLLVRALGLEAGRLMAVVVAIHLPLMSIGWLRLMHRLGVRPLFAGVGALSISLGFFVTSVASAWIFMLCIAALLPWIVYGIAKHLDEGGWSGSIPLVLGLAASAWVGHPQMLIYQWLVAGLFALGFALTGRRTARLRLGSLALLCSLALLLSLPALWPIYQMLPLSQRAQAVDLGEFLNRSVDPGVLIGWLYPAHRSYNAFLPDRASYMAYQGAWMIPSILGGGVAMLRMRRREPPRACGAHAATQRAFGLSLVIACILLVLALGANTPIYPLTHGIPVWSSLRWPFKFFLFSQAFLGLAATLGLECWARALPGSRLLRLFPAPFVGIALALAWHDPELSTVPAESLSIGLGAISLVALAGLDRSRAVRITFAVAVFLGIVVLTARAHMASLKTYTEVYAGIGAEELGLRTDTRVLPVSYQSTGMGYLMQRLSLFHSATANGYDSATGVTAGLIPTLYAETLPTHVDGLVYRDFLTTFLGSRLLRVYNIGNLVVYSGDQATRALIEATGGFTLVHEAASSATYAVPDALPRAWFATRTQPFTLQAYRRGLLLNRSPATTAFVENWKGSQHQPAGRVVRADWGATRSILWVEAPRGGFLVLSLSWFPGWSCTIDGEPASIERVDHRLMGVRVPRYARTVVLEYRTPGFRAGLLAALAGLLLALGVRCVRPARTLLLRRRQRAHTASR